MFNFNTKNDIIGCTRESRCISCASEGNLSDSYLKQCIFVCFHNHPSGSSIEFREDIEVNKSLKECGNLIDIRILDCVIIGDNSYVSLMKKGII
ncbi:JAB domain-containing protein [Bacillus paramycoides]|uniref:JAB domain-containing protein n=1 Tax=Bacillus paramycoides TaxID=2026194 RepID=UPI00399CC1C8